MNYSNIAKEVLEMEANELLRASKELENNIEKIVELIYNSKGKLIITGVGKSGLVGAKMAATFASTGTPSFFLHPTEAMHGDLGMIGKDDVVLGISYSGESEELIRILPHLKRLNIPLISMAKSKDTTLGRYGDAFIKINIQKEACPLNIAPTTSTTLTLALGDALAVCLMKRRNFKKEDFASFHPGGSLGKQLFIKIEDLMKKENLPIVPRETILKDAIIAMNEGMLGSVVIVDKDKKVLGLLSDGDLRRFMTSKDFTLDCLAYEISSKNPKTLQNTKLLASDALKLIEEYKIQILIITDDKGKVKGLLHIHDLIEAGIKHD